MKIKRNYHLIRILSKNNLVVIIVNETRKTEE
jgi:hypothetical protein